MFSGGVCVWGPLIRTPRSALVEFSSLPFITPQVTFFLNIILHLEPRHLPRLDRGTLASLVGIMGSCMCHSVHFSGIWPDRFLLSTPIGLRQPRSPCDSAGHFAVGPSGDVTGLSAFCAASSLWMLSWESSQIMSSCSVFVICLCWPNLPAGQLFFNASSACHIRS